MNPPSTPVRAAPTVILVAEDNKYDRMILQEAFGELGFDVELRFVVNGEELLDYLHSRNGYVGQALDGRPMVVLMDLNMPRMNGAEALRSIRADAKFRTLPAVILSTSDNPKQISQAYADGANAFMTKPGGFDDMVKLILGFGTFWLREARLPVLEPLQER